MLALKSTIGLIGWTALSYLILLGFTVICRDFYLDRIQRVVGTTLIFGNWAIYPLLLVILLLTGCMRLSPEAQLRGLYDEMFRTNEAICHSKDTVERQRLREKLKRQIGAYHILQFQVEDKTLPAGIVYSNFTCAQEVEVQHADNR